MSLPISGGLPRLPSQAPETSNQPPAPAGNLPVLHGHVPASSAQQEPVPVDDPLSCSEPQLISRTGPVLAAPPADDAEQAFADAVLRGDIEAVHRLVDQGVDLSVDHQGQSLLAFALTHLTDAKIIDCLLDTAGADAHKLASLLCQAAVNGGNPVALECLRRSGIINNKRHKDALLACAFVAFREGPAAKLDASVQAWLQHFPDESPGLDDFVRLLEKNPDKARLRSLAAIGTLDITKHLRAINGLLRDAIQRNDEGFARALIDWLKQSDEFGKHGCLPLGMELDTLGDDALCMLARAGLPFALHLDAIPQFKQPEREDEFRAALYGSDLAASPLAELTRNGAVSPAQLMELLCSCVVNGNSRMEVHDESSQRYVASALYLSGFERLVASELSHIIASSGYAARSFINRKMFVFAAAVNELQASETLAACTDPGVRRQFEMVVNAAHEMIQSMVGAPRALAADLLGCVTRLGKVDYFKLKHVLEHRKGLPSTLWEQLHSLLKASVAWARNQPAEIPTGTLSIQGIQAAMHQQMLVKVFERLLTEMPRSLQSREMTVRANEADLSEEERIAQHAAIEVLKQYCEQLAQDADQEILAVLALVKAAGDDDDDDSSSDS